MSKRLEEIMQRQELLIARSETQRGELAWLAQNIHRPLRFIDQGLAVISAFRLHPVLSAVAVSLLVAAPKNKLLLWMSRAFTGYELYKAVSDQWPRRRD